MVIALKPGPNGAIGTVPATAHRQPQRISEGEAMSDKMLAMILAFQP
jgi:hypothetical protein